MRAEEKRSSNLERTAFRSSASNSGMARRSAVLSSTPFRRFGSAVVRRSIDRLQRNPFALRLASDWPDGSLKLDAHDTCGRICLRKLLKHPYIGIRPKLARTTLVGWVRLARTLLADRRAGPLPCCFCHLLPPLLLNEGISEIGSTTSIVVPGTSAQLCGLSCMRQGRNSRVGTVAGNDALIAEPFRA